MQDSNTLMEVILRVIIGIILITLFVFVLLIQTSASMDTQSVITNLFIH